MHSHNLWNKYKIEYNLGENTILVPIFWDHS